MVDTEDMVWPSGVSLLSTRSFGLREEKMEEKITTFDVIAGFVLGIGVMLAFVAISFLLYWFVRTLWA